MKVKRFFVGFLLALLAFIFLPKGIFADLAGLQSEYSQALADFNKAYSSFQIAKNSYQTYKTLAAKTESLTKTKDLMEKKDTLIMKHFAFLKEKVNSSIGISDEEKKYLFEQADREILFYQNHLSLIPAISTLKDAVTQNNKITDQIKLTDIKSKQILGQVLIDKVLFSEREYDQLSALFEEITMTDKRISPNKQEKIRRWLLEVKNKKILCDNLLASAQKKLAAFKIRDEVNQAFNNVRIEINQANLYLKEGSSYLNEIKEELKYD